MPLENMRPSHAVSSLLLSFLLLLLLIDIILVASIIIPFELILHCRILLISSRLSENRVHSRSLQARIGRKLGQSVEVYIESFIIWDPTTQTCNLRDKLFVFHSKMLWLWIFSLSFLKIWMEWERSSVSLNDPAMGSLGIEREPNSSVTAAQVASNEK